MFSMMGVFSELEQASLGASKLRLGGPMSDQLAGSGGPGALHPCRCPV